MQKILIDIQIKTIYLRELKRRRDDKKRKSIETIQLEDADEDDDTSGEVLDEDESGDEDTEEREAHVPPELQLDHLVSFPAGILVAHRKCSVGKVGFGNNLFDFIHGWDPF